MINKNILIAILARDCNKALKKNIPLVEELRKHFSNSKVVVVENDSKDGTKETLEKWEKESNNVTLIIKDNGTITIPRVSTNCPHPANSLFRISKMAYYRNLYMEYAKSLNENFDYLIVIDIDVENFSINGIVESIKNAPENWGGLFANGYISYNGIFPHYFDIYAYLPKCISNLSQKHDELYYYNRLLNKQLNKEKYIECNSAFGGLGIYKWQTIKDLSYKAIENNRSVRYEAICEHVPFNYAIIEKGFKNYICKRITVNYGKRSLYHILTYTLIPKNIFAWLYKLVKGRKFED